MNLMDIDLIYTKYEEMCVLAQNYTNVRNLDLWK